MATKESNLFSTLPTDLKIIGTILLIFEEFKIWISGKNLLIPFLFGCLVYSICICTITDVEDYCYSSIYEWSQGFQQHHLMKKTMIPDVPKINLPKLLQKKTVSSERNLEREKIALILVSLLFLGVLVYNLAKLIKEMCCKWNRSRTVLQINNDDKWEYAPSINKIEATKSQ